MGTTWILFTSFTTITSGLVFARCINAGTTMWAYPDTVNREQRGLKQFVYAILCFFVPVKIFPISLDHLHIGVAVFLWAAAIGICFIKLDPEKLKTDPVHPKSPDQKD